MEAFYTLRDKIIIESDIELLTGMHIGASNDFSPIGAVDSVVVKDPLSGTPIIPGSTIKGKLRTMMAKLLTDNYILPDHEKDDIRILKLFGSSAKNNIIEARLQFCDLFMINGNDLLSKNLDLGYTEIKFENRINRMTAEATPRQLERVPKGSIFKFKLIYNLFKSENNEDFSEKDFILISNGIKALQLDYIGGSGTRGYGKISFSNFRIKRANLTSEGVNTDSLLNILRESENFLAALTASEKSNDK